jgi:hypothetical protein
LGAALTTPFKLIEATCALIEIAGNAPPCVNTSIAHALVRDARKTVGLADGSLTTDDRIHRLTMTEMMGEILVEGRVILSGCKGVLVSETRAAHAFQISLADFRKYARHDAATVAG